jgi:hypothetical protein
MGALGTPFFGPTNGTFAGGGGATDCGGAGGAAGSGGGAVGQPGAPGAFGQGASGTVNTGGGAGAGYGVGAACVPATGGGAGGSGRVIINFPDSDTIAVTPVTNSVNPSPGSTKTAVFTVSGTLTVT